MDTKKIDLSTTVTTIIKPNLGKSEKECMKMEKEKCKRIIAETDGWTFAEEELSAHIQRDMMRDYFQDKELFLENERNKMTMDMIFKQIRGKMSGYRSQDVEKTLLDPSGLVTLDDIVELFKTSDMLCFYCKEPVLVLYEYVRDPKQWTLDRMDNKKGHNKGNVEIACLQCNLRRRCMHQDRYISTKKMGNVVKLG
jgi:hypothetical protein